MVKYFFAFLASCFLCQQAFATQEGALTLSKFQIESGGNGSFGSVILRGQRSAEGAFESLSVTFAGKTIDISPEISSKIPKHANGIELGFVDLPASDGGRVVLIGFQFGFSSISSLVNRYTVIVTEKGDVSTRCLRADCNTEGNYYDELEIDPESGEALASLPPFSPSRTAVVVKHASFDARCTSNIARETHDIDILYSVVTESKEWGRVWRADAYSNLTKHSLRLVCWNSPYDASDQVLFRAKYLDDTDRELPGR